MNNLISEANDLFKAAGAEQDPELVRKAINKISMQISQALTPLNSMNLPFVVAVLLSYVELLEKELKPNQYAAFLATKMLIENDSGKYTFKTPTTDIRGE